MRQYLFHQVVDDVAVVPGEPGDEAADVVAPLDRECGELERGDPPLRALLQRTDVRLGEVQSRHLVQVRGGLAGSEAQIGGADLDELATRSHPGQWERRVGAAGDHQMRLRGEVLQQEGHPVVDLGRVDDVVVVEHLHDVVGEGAQIVEQSGEDRLGRRSGRRQERQRSLAELVRRSGHRRQGGDQVRPEPRGIVVPPVERQPGRGSFTTRRGCQPVRQQRRLAEPGRSRHERQRRPRPPAQTLAQPGPGDQRAPRPGDVELGLEQRPGHEGSMRRVEAPAVVDCAGSGGFRP